MRLLFLASMLILVVMNASAWRGYDWERWRAVSRESLPDLATPQSGKADILPLLQTGGPKNLAITSLNAWNAKRDRIRGTLKTLLGEPTDLKIPVPAAQVISETDAGDHLRQHVRILSEPEDWISAYVLLPKPRSEARLPVMIVIHQTSRQGKDEPCGVETIAPSNPDLRIGVELVRRGYAVVAPDMIGFGERIADGDQPYDGIMRFFDRHPHWSVFGKTAWDANRTVDWIEMQSWADAQRIGAIGHSHGAYSSIISAAFEPRIRAVIASCGFTTLRADPHPERWSHMTPLLPRLGFYAGDIKYAPTDWHEIISLLTPRAFYDWQPLQDDNFQNTENLAEVFKELREINVMEGRSPDSMKIIQKDGAHSFPPEAREAAYAWLDKIMKED